MERTRWLGLGLGLAIGVMYGLLHWLTLRGGPGAQRPGKMFASATARLVLVMVALLLVLRFTNAHRYWLLGSLMVSYGVVFVWTMRRMLVKKK